MDINSIPGISEQICTELLQVFRRFDRIDKVLLFGSRAKNTYYNGSDIDLAVIGEQLSGEDFSRLWNEIDALPIIFKIDLLHWNHLINDSLKEKILVEGQVFYQGDAQ
jgi:predicted nucleotidyltransferase